MKPGGPEATGILPYASARPVPHNLPILLVKSDETPQQKSRSPLPEKAPSGPLHEKMPDGFPPPLSHKRIIISATIPKSNQQIQCDNQYGQPHSDPVLLLELPLHIPGPFGLFPKSSQFHGIADRFDPV